MIDPPPTADRALPLFDPWKFLFILTAASTLATGMGGGARATAAAQADARLLDLVARHARQAPRQDALEDAVRKAWLRYREPTIPEALHWREGDEALSCIEKWRLLVNIIDGRRIYVYDDAPSIDALRGWIAAIRETGSDASRFYSLARTTEILTAYDALIASRERAGEEAGLTQALVAAQRSESVIAALLREIALTPATTVAGFAAKAQLGVSMYGLGNLDLDAHRTMLEDVVEKTFLGGTGWGEALGMSLSLDASILAAETAAGGKAAT